MIGLKDCFWLMYSDTHLKIHDTLPLKTDLLTNLCPGERGETVPVLAIKWFSCSGAYLGQPNRFDLAQAQHGPAGQHNLVLYRHCACLQPANRVRWRNGIPTRTFTVVLKERKKYEKLKRKIYTLNQTLCNTPFRGKATWDFSSQDVLANCPQNKSFRGFRFFRQFVEIFDFCAYKIKKNL